MRSPWGWREDVPDERPGGGRGSGGLGARVVEVDADF